jgi:anti-sigma factor RsiW
MSHSIDEQELHLYVDRRLDREREALIERELRRDPEMAARVSDFRRQNELMRQLFAAGGDVPSGVAQQRLQRALERRLGRSRLIAYWRPSAAAAAALLLAGGLGAAATAVYDGRDTRSAAPAASSAETAASIRRVDAGMSSEPTEPTEFTAEGAATLRLLLDKRLGAPLRLPDLSAEGFSLVRGRLLPTPEGAAAQLLYRDQAGRIVTVFLGPADRAPFAPFPAAEQQSLSLYVRHDGRIGVAVAGGMSSDELRGLADAAQRSLLPAAEGAAPAPGPAVQVHDASRT